MQEVCRATPRPCKKVPDCHACPCEEVAKWRTGPCEEIKIKERRV